MVFLRKLTTLAAMSCCSALPLGVQAADQYSVVDKYMVIEGTSAYIMTMNFSN